MKICIVSDSHDRADPLAQAVREAKALGAEVVIHCGDLIGAQTMKPALAAGLPVHAIHGNNLGDPQAMQFQSKKSGGQGIGAVVAVGNDADLHPAMLRRRECGAQCFSRKRG